MLDRDESKSYVDHTDSPELGKFSPNRRGSNFPKFTGVRKSQSLATEITVAQKVTLEALLKTTLRSYNTIPQYFAHLPCNLTCQSLISNALNHFGHKEGLENKKVSVIIEMMGIDFGWKIENE